MNENCNRGIRWCDWCDCESCINNGTRKARHETRWHDDQRVMSLLVWKDVRHDNGYLLVVMTQLVSCGPSWPCCGPSLTSTVRYTIAPSFTAVRRDHAAVRRSPLRSVDFVLSNENNILRLFSTNTNAVRVTYQSKHRDPWVIAKKAQWIWAIFSTEVPPVLLLEIGLLHCSCCTLTLVCFWQGHSSFCLWRESFPVTVSSKSKENNSLCWMRG